MQRPSDIVAQPHLQLIDAIKAKNSQVAKNIIQKSSVDELVKIDENKESAWELAIQYNQLEVIRDLRTKTVPLPMLRYSFDPEAQRFTSEKYQSHADFLLSNFSGELIKGHFNGIIDLFLAAEETTADALLFEAADRGFDLVVEYLVEHKGANVLAKSLLDDRIALHLAATQSHIEVATVLLRKNAKEQLTPVTKTHALTALHLAINSTQPRRVEMCKLLINAGADPDTQNGHKIAPRQYSNAPACVKTARPLANGNTNTSRQSSPVQQTMPQAPAATLPTQLPAPHKQISPPSPHALAVQQPISPTGPGISRVSPLKDKLGHIHQLLSTNEASTRTTKTELEKARELVTQLEQELLKLQEQKKKLSVEQKKHIDEEAQSLREAEAALQERKAYLASIQGSSSSVSQNNMLRLLHHAQNNVLAALTAAQGQNNNNNNNNVVLNAPQSPVASNGHGSAAQVILPLVPAAFSSQHKGTPLRMSQVQMLPPTSQVPTRNDVGSPVAGASGNTTNSVLGKRAEPEGDETAKNKIK